MKNKLITIFSIVVFCITIYSLIENIVNRNKQLQYEYIQDCLYELRKFDYSELEKHQACSCRYYYLFSKYGKSIFNDEFVIPTKSDSLAVINCLLEALSLDSINGEEILIKMNELHK